MAPLTSGSKATSNIDHSFALIRLCVGFAFLALFGWSLGHQFGDSYASREFVPHLSTLLISILAPAIVGAALVFNAMPSIAKRVHSAGTWKRQVLVFVLSLVGTAVFFGLSNKFNNAELPDESIAKIFAFFGLYSFLFTTVGLGWKLTKLTFGRKKSAKP